MSTTSQKALERTGLTLIELLTVFAVISIVGSLTLVAVQAMREASRKVACQNNLHQIALGLQSSVSQHKSLPSLRRKFKQAKLQERFSVNPIVAISEQMEIRFEVRHGNLWTSEPGAGESLPPSQFRCASNGDSRLAYRLNMGIELDENWARLLQKDKLFREVKEGESGMRLGEVTDGLSNTIALSERFSPEAVIRKPSAIAEVNVAPPTEQEREKHCENALLRGDVMGVLEEWWSGAHYECGYTHFDSPNASTTDCEVNALFASGKVSYRVAARSWHNGGVQACKLDGSTAWISSSIDLKVWRALSTPNASDLVSE